MATGAFFVLTLLLFVCVHTGVECDSSCSNMLECTMYTIQEVGRRVDNMQSNMAAIGKQLIQIQNDSPDIKDMVLELKDQLDTQMAIIDAMMVDNGYLKIKNQKLEERVNHLTLSLADQFISFTAYASLPRSYEVGDTVIFDQEVVNYGSYFNPSSSIFTCPVSGYYLFQASLLSDRDHSIGSRIYLDDNFIIGAYTDGRSETYDTASMLIVTRCKEGSSVRVKINIAGDMYGSGSRETIFTGTLLGLI